MKASKALATLSALALLFCKANAAAPVTGSAAPEPNTVTLGVVAGLVLVGLRRIKHYIRRDGHKR